jgi:hypothetical protein
MGEAAKILALAVAAAVLYGVVQDQIAARVSVEYFAVAHRRLVDTRSPTGSGSRGGQSSEGRAPTSTDAT